MINQRVYQKNSQDENDWEDVRFLPRPLGKTLVVKDLDFKFWEGVTVEKGFAYLTLQLGHSDEVSESEVLCA